MEKKLDLSRSVYELVSEYPELADILYNVGLKDIRKTKMFHTVAKLMTIPKGAKMRGIPMEKVLLALIDNGFILEGEMPSKAASKEPKPEEKKDDNNNSNHNQSSKAMTPEEIKAMRESIEKTVAEKNAAELKALKDDKRLIVSASGHAQKAADYILGNSEKEPQYIETEGNPA